MANLSLGKYTLIGEIARGGMGIVYLAQTQGPGGFKKTVVVKELKPELSDEPKFRDMFLEEANLAARLNHRNIVQTNEVGQDGDRYFIAMDYLEGCSLHTARKRLVGERKLPLASQLRVVSEILAGLHYAHELTDYDGSPMGVVHRDVGPQNVFLTYDGQVKLIDFGVAKVLNREQETQAGVLKGRVVYMAPEQVTGGSIDRRADIFAAGVLLREVITGKRLWEGLSEIDTLKKLIAGAIPVLPEGVEMPAELRAICEKAMAPDREDRFKTAHEMRVRLEQYVARADPAGSLADLGAHLSRELAAERRRLKDIVDGHLAAGSSDRLPAVDILAPGSSPDLTSGVGSGPRASSGPSAPPSTTRRAKTPPSGTVVSGEMPEVDVAIDDVPPNAARRKRSAVIAIAAIAAVVGLSTLLVVRRNNERASSAPVSSSALGGTAPPPPVATGPSADEHVENVEITVRVSPLNARIFVDEAPVEGNPYHATFARNAVATHAIRAVAPGFVQRTELVKFDANSNVTMSLERQAPAGQPQQPAIVVRADVRAAAPPVAAPPSQTPTATTKPSSTDINPRGGKVPKREIDGKNPYGAE